MLRKCLTTGINNLHQELFKTSLWPVCSVNMSSEDTLKRKNEDILSSEENSKKLKNNEEALIEIDVTSNRIRKPKKVALLLCYLGKNYFGMQRNNNVSTVEEALLKALLEAKIILQTECEFPKTMKFQRAARTDKGVSAARQLVSLKIPISEISDALQEKVNKYLPPEIRVLGVIRVTQSFDAKIACDARTYSYMLPTFAFSYGDDGNKEQYRITDERIEEVNKFLKLYTGTHNFYNFTSGRLPNDPSCKRFIISCECGPAFKLSELEFAVIRVKGQSFMLHQIRKMVGLAIAYMRKLADESVLQKSWLNQRIDVPKAPGLGLMLEELHYDWYNTKYGKDGMHKALEWSEYDDIVNNFKEKQICASIAETEREEKSMLQWLETLPYHSYDVREAAAPGLIPSKNSVTVVNSVHNAEENTDSSSEVKISLEENMNSSEENRKSSASEANTNLEENMNSSSEVNTNLEENKEFLVSEVNTNLEENTNSSASAVNQENACCDGNEDIKLDN